MAPKTMDPAQAKAWASHHRHTIIEAGAGSGKTYLLVERTALLIEKGAEPESLALISFTREASKVLKERLEARLGKKVAERLHVSTIHKFAKQVAERLGLPAEYSIHDPDYPFDPYRVAWRKVLDRRLKGPEGPMVGKTLLTWLGSDLIDEEEKPFLYPDLHGEPTVSADGLFVRSKAEASIVKRFREVSLPFVYEDLVIGGSFPFRPDFYLPTSGVWVEYLGLYDHSDPEIQGPYRAAHQRKKREMARLGLDHLYVSVYPSELKNETWLTKILKVKGDPALAEKARRLAIERLKDRADSLFEMCRELSHTLIRFERAVDRPRYPYTVRPLVDLVREMHNEVCDQLLAQGTHEADSFIAALGAYLQANPARAKQALGPITTLAVDESQDLHPALFSMLQPLMNAASSIVIGDPRQAIYGFTGGTPAFMRHFARWVPGARRVVLPVNRRSSPEIITASEAVLPAGSLRARPFKPKGGEVLRVNVPDEAGQAAALLQAIRRRWPEGSMMVLSRYNPPKAEAAAYGAAADDLGIPCLTFHGSKGLEADTVVVTGLVFPKKGSWCIPSRRRDNPMVAAVKLANQAEQLEREEARLLYVALSRARSRLILVTSDAVEAPLAMGALSKAKKWDFTALGE